MARYEVINRSVTDHCCFNHSVVDTTISRVDALSVLCERFNKKDAQLVCDALNNQESAPYQSARVSFLLASLRDLGVSDVDEKTPVNALYQRLGDALARTTTESQAVSELERLIADIRSDRRVVESFELRASVWA